jgi:4-aminobutyrate aminotransferase-like enzyme
VVLPDGYLSQVYDKVRAVGGLCIADEVQVGLGRVGSHTWAFETQGVVPDIVTLGKPMGNGHALAAVITTREIAESFNNGMEYFNTFGGNPVSCAIGLAVLEVVEEERLQANALNVGAQFIKELSNLKSKFEVIGDVRGLGLFLGVELVNSRDTLSPAAKQTSYIVERMKQNGILISTDGPLHNVLKIKPPMCFNQANVAQVISTLEMVLQEDYAQVEK